MPENISLQRIFDEMRSTHEALKQHVDKQLEEIRTTGAASAETTAAVEKINADLTQLRKDHDEAVAQQQRTATGNVPDETASDTEQLHRRAYEKFIRHGVGETGRSLMEAEEYRALSDASDADGGFLVPTSFESDVITQAFDEASIRPFAQPRPTGRSVVQMPALGKPVVAWGRRNVAVDPQDIGVGTERMEIFDQRALVLIHNNTLDDADADVWGELQDQFSPALAESEDDAFAVGAGDDSPQGILAHAGVLANYKPSGVAAGLTDGSNNGVDALIQVMYAVKKAYRRNGTWLFNSQTEATIRTLKDSNGQYLWQPPVQAGTPALLLGRPIGNPEGLPDIAANAYPIVFGDIRRGYKIRDRAGMTVQRLVEKYAEYDQTGFIVKRRVGGQVTLAEAFSVMKIATT